MIALARALSHMSYLPKWRISAGIVKGVTRGAKGTALAMDADMTSRALRTLPEFYPSGRLGLPSLLPIEGDEESMVGEATAEEDLSDFSIDELLRLTMAEGSKLLEGNDDGSIPVVAIADCVEEDAGDRSRATVLMRRASPLRLATIGLVTAAAVLFALALAFGRFTRSPDASVVTVAAAPAAPSPEPMLVAAAPPSPVAPVAVAAPILELPDSPIVAAHPAPVVAKRQPVTHTRKAAPPVSDSVEVAVAKPVVPIEPKKAAPAARVSDEGSREIAKARAAAETEIGDTL